MKRRAFRVILTSFSLLFILLSSICSYMYYYMNKEYYINIFKERDIYNIVNISAFLLLAFLLLVYTFGKLIVRGITTDKDYVEKIKYQSFGFLTVYIIVWIIIVAYLIFASVTLGTPLATVTLLVAAGFDMAVTLVFYLDILLPNYIKDKL